MLQIFDKVYGCIRNQDKAKYLTLFESEKDESLFDRVRYLILLKCNKTDLYFHNLKKPKTDLGDDLPLKQQ